MTWKTMDVHEQRVQFVVTASRAEQPLCRLCQEFGISRPTGLLWMKRFRESGLAGLVERSRRPQRSPRQTAAELEAPVVELRRRYPDWGARKLQVLLREQGVHLPRNTIHRILLRHGLVQDEPRQTSATQRFERAAPNQLWQMDFKGAKRRWTPPLGPLSVIDDHSRYVVALEAVPGMHTEAVREPLESAFAASGVPDAMLMDHGTPWWSMQSPGGLTGLSIWLMKQGIELYWSGIRHPQTQGKVERFHGEMQRALDLRPPMTGDAQTWLDEFRWEHNHVRPHEALGMRTPASVWHPSARRYDPKPPAWEYAPGGKVLKVDCEGKVDAWGQRWRIAVGLSGERVNLVRLEERVLVFYCRTLIRELDLGMQCSTIVEHCIPAKVPYPKP
jgi:transposase InsO family protein